MLKYLSILILMTLIFIQCGGDKGNGYKKLDGTWTNPMMTVNYDTKKGVSNVTALGETKETKIKLVEDKGNIVKFLSNESEITAQFADNDTMVLTKKGGIPVEMKRKK